MGVDDSKILLVDTSGMHCPQPVIELQSALRKADSGDLVRVIATDRGSLYDIPTWVKINKHELVQQAQETEVFEFLIKVR